MKFELWTGRIIRLKHDILNARKTARRSSSRLPCTNAASSRDMQGAAADHEHPAAEDITSAALRLEVRSK